MRARSNSVPINKRKIHVVSLGFENSIFNEAFFGSDLISDNRLIDANPVLVDRLAEDIGSRQNRYVESIFMNGSYRQSATADAINSTSAHQHARSCFTALEAFPKAVIERIDRMLAQDSDLDLDSHKKISLDRYLLADTFGHQKPGINFVMRVEQLQIDQRNSEARKEIKQFGSAKYEKRKVEHFERPFDFSEWKHDDSKLTILYAQIHKIASAPENHDTEIVFDFYDNGEHVFPKDRHLNKLHVFFSTNRDLIPSNVTLRIHQYTGEEIIDKEPIVGDPNLGGIDYLFEESIAAMFRCTGVPFAEVNVHYNMMDALLKGFNLRKFKNQRRMTPVGEEWLVDSENLESVMKRLHDDEPANSDAYLAELDHQIGLVQKKCQRGNAYDTDFLQSLIKLRLRLRDDLDRQITKGSSVDKIDSSEAMVIANQTTELLKSLRGSSSISNSNTAIETYKTNCDTTSRCKRILKLVAAVAIAAVGAVIGGAIGFGIGMAATPAGGITGMLIGGAVGFSAGFTIGAYLLFKPSKVHKQAKEVAEKATEKYVPELEPLAHQVVPEEERSLLGGESRDLNRNSILSMN